MGHTVSMFDVPTGWHMGEQYGFELADVEALPFVACSGDRGFFGNFDQAGNRLDAPAMRARKT